MPERDFLQLFKFCPRLEEMEVFSKAYWNWDRVFVDNVVIFCHGVRRLHLTTSYGSANSENNTNHTPDPMRAEIVIFDKAVPDSAQASSTLGVDAAGSPLPFDPMVELVKLYPELVSYDARCVRFHNRALMTLQQTCRQLERLDLTLCQELSSKAVDRFPRNAPTLKHFSASQILLRIEDLIEAAEEHDRAVATHGNNIIASEQKPRWWTCQDLETFIIGVKNPVLPCASRGFDLQSELATYFQSYFRYGQVGSSSKAHGIGNSSSGGGHGSSHQGSEQLNDHIQYYTFVLFQQLGRLRKLTRLALHEDVLISRCNVRPRTCSSRLIATLEWTFSARGS
ncbi:hypothetical protein BG011_001497 [Mortierella polycephala]|uniref:Uncharacterized protein n=1 Tax=Mortierella polycephala TaxID=41804 RepID=A0A9P6QFC5_9FUNG|nr:hypothetical protein BG011_001497 [Mortierella polycephala]